MESPGPLKELRVAIVHDWLTGMRGGEKVLAELCGLFQRAEIFTLFHRPGSVSPQIEKNPIHVSFLGRLPSVQHYYRYLLPLMPLAVKAMKIRGFDLLISSSHCVALAARTENGAPHLSYCHSPMRYVWDQFDSYFSPEKSSLLTRTAAKLWRPWLQRNDVAAGSRVGRFVANSRFVARRIRTIYGRDAAIIHPGIDTDYFKRRPRRRGNFALMVTALVPYKNVELALEAFRDLDMPLIVIGSGPARGRLEKQASSNVDFKGWQSDETVRKYYSEARLLVFPGCEDFGMVPVEAMACGLPVVALARGGALETVREPETGIFFSEPTASALANAVTRAARMSFDGEKIRKWTLRFSRLEFVRKMQQELTSFLADPSR